MFLEIHIEIESWKVERLIPYARNARTHTVRQVAQIAESITAFGFANPVLADPNGSIIAGHARVLAARKLGMEEVPVIVLHHLNEDQKRAFRIADNKLAMNAGWDEEALRQELDELAARGFKLDVIGFDERELKDLVSRHQPAGNLDPEETPEPEADAVSIPGDLWALGDHRLLCGDGTSVEQLRRVLDGRSCDLAFTDLPYNVSYVGKTARKMKLVNDNLGDGFENFLKAACLSLVEVSAGPIYICMSSSELHRLYAAFTEAGGHWSTFIIWAKSLFTLGHADYQRQFEPILYGWKEGGPHYWCGARNQGDIWMIDKPRVNDLHPTMKPIALVERAIENSSRKGNVVLDPFAGSGTTAIACERLGRHACLVEIDPCYADVIVRRWEGYTGRSAELVGDGRSFEQIQQERLTKKAA